ncbi:hypothetical protein VTH06DRAFT_1204 [Thermothelomyces fergusii]
MEKPFWKLQGTRSLPWLRKHDPTPKTLTSSLFFLVTFFPPEIRLAQIRQYNRAAKEKPTNRPKTFLWGEPFPVVGVINLPFPDFFSHF